MKPTSADDRSSHAHSIDPEAVAELLNTIGGDRVVLQELVLTFLDESRDILRMMHSAAANCDRALLYRCVHTLKTGANTLGAVRLARLCADTERRSQTRWPVDALSRVECIASEFERVERLLPTVAAAH